MKSFYSLLCGLLVVATGCTIEVLEHDDILKTFDCFTVSIEDSELTKVHIENGTDVKWNDMECIGVFSDTQGFVPYYRQNDGLFHGDPVSGHVFYAVSPFTPDDQIGGRQGYFFDEDNRDVLHLKEYVGRCVMIAKSSDSNLLFKHTGGVLHFKLKSSKAASAGVTVTGNHYEWIGEGRINLAEEIPVIRFEGFGTKIQDYGAPDYDLFSTMYTKNGDNFDIYLGCPLMSFENGFRVFAGGLDENWGSVFQIKKTTHKTVEIQRGVMLTYDLGDMDTYMEDEIKCVESDRQALIAFYNAMNGDNWKINDNWCSEKPLNEWYGVETNGVGRVTGIVLSNNLLNGYLPDDICKLDRLEVLYLTASGRSSYDATEIKGTLPEKIGDLVNLEHLLIRPSMLTGPIPESMKKLSSLQTFCIDGKYDKSSGERLPGYGLSGGLDIITSLPVLTSITLSKHVFSGQLPPFANRRISEITMQEVGLSGPLPDLSSLNYLWHLQLNNNGFTGPLPDLSNMTELTQVYLHNNNFSGSVPAGYANVFNNRVTQFWLFGNRLTGSIPVSIINHPAFPRLAGMILADQQDGYGFTVDRVPAIDLTYDTLDGGSMNLGEQYSKVKYTMIVRWAEWCNFSYSFIPDVVRLANRYKSEGLQTIWAYAGGDEQERISYMSQVGLDQFDKHIIEFHQGGLVDFTSEYPIWCSWMVGTPFVEVVDSEGNVVFVDNSSCVQYSQMPFAYPREDLESFLISVLGDGEEEELYQSADYSTDGTVHQLHTATVGNGIDLVLMGDAFSDRLISDGTYASVMSRAMDAFFSEEPYKSFKDYFNVYYVDVVSRNEMYYGKTELNTWYGKGTDVGGDNDKVREYAGKAVSVARLNDAIIVVLMNRDYYAGTCYMSYVNDGNYGRGNSIAYFPTSSNSSIFNGLVSHEACGHGFAKLDDEYAYEGTVPGDYMDSRHKLEPYGWWKNVDFTSDPSAVKWSQFINDYRYASENIGVYEGASTYAHGAWRPTENSIMRYNEGGFNAPSRYAIWYRINKLAFGPEWNGTYEDFVEYDAVNRTPAANQRRIQRTLEAKKKNLPPLAPPVVLEDSWQSARH